MATQEHVETILGPENNNKIHTADRTNAGVAVISWASFFFTADSVIEKKLIPIQVREVIWPRYRTLPDKFTWFKTGN